MLLPDEGHAVAEASYSRLITDYALVPSLWWFEMRNIFVSNERRGRIGSEQTARALTLLGGLPVQLDRTPDSTILMALARKHRLTAYDAAYLELATREAIPIATLDGALARAAVAEGAALIR